MTSKLIPLATLLLAAALFSCKTPQAAAPPAPKASLSERLEKIKMTDLQGNAFTLHAYAGKPVFLNFWATWCRPCISEMQSIEAAYAQLGKEVAFLAVSSESPEKIQAFLEKNKFSFPIAHLDINYIDVYIVKMPTTFLIDASGNLVLEEEGYRDWMQYGNLEKIKSLVKRR
jgi:peroxiredoxin